MEQISEEKFREVEIKVEDEEEDEEEAAFKITESDFETMMAKMENPVEAQKELAIRIKLFLDDKMEKEIKDKGLTDSTRRWIETYNSILDKIQKNIHGDKSVNFHTIKVSHSDIATKIRESNKK